MHRTYDIRELKLNGTVSRLFRLIGVEVLLLFLFNLTTHAQPLRLPLKPSAGEYVFNEIKLPGDLSFRDVIALQQDKHGFVWLASKHGLMRYDGHDFKTYRHVPGDTTSLIDTELLSLRLLGDTLLCIGGVHGVSLIDIRTQKITNLSCDQDGEPVELVNDIFPDPDGTIWLAALNGLYSLNAGFTGIINHHLKQPPFTKGNPTFAKRVYCIAQHTMDKNRLLLGVERGVLSFDKRRNRLHKIHPNTEATFSYSEPTVYRFKTEGNYLWALCWISGLPRFDMATETWRNFGYPKFDKQTRTTTNVWAVSDFMVKNGNELWVCDWDRGLFVFDKSTQKLVQPEQAKNSDVLRKAKLNIFQLSDGAIWLSGKDGLWRQNLRAKQFRELDIPFPHTWIMGMLHDEETDEYYFGLFLNSYGLACWNARTQQWTFYPPETNRQEMFSSTDIFKDSRGVLWVATSIRGLWYVDKQSKMLRQFIPPDKNHPDQWGNTIFKIFEDSQHNLWLGTGKFGVIRLNSDRTKADYFMNNPADSTSLYGKTRFYAIEEDHRGRIWIGCRTGFCTYDPQTGKFSRDIPRKLRRIGVRDGDVCAIVKDTTNAMWLTIEGQGLVKVKEQADGGFAFKVYQTDNGLKDLMLRYMTTDRQGNFWIVNNGLLYFNPYDESFMLTDERNGLLENLEGDDRIMVDRYGNVFCGGQVGIGWLNEVERYSRSSISNLIIETVSINSRAVSDWNPYAERAALPTVMYDRNNFTFSYTAICFEDYDQVRYRYKLEGLEKDWNPPTTLLEARYTNLKPGKYRFVVDAAYKGNWLGYNRTVEFEISQVFWKTGWFISFVLLTVAGIGLIIYRVRREQEEKRKRIRLKIASDLHDDVGSTLSSISIMSDLLQSRPEESPNSEEMLRKIGSDARNLLDSMDDIIWSVNPQNDSFQNIVVRIREYAIPLFEPLDVKFSVVISAGILSLQLPMDKRRNLFLIAKEAINNAAKYSGCTEASIEFFYARSILKMTVSDNGRGFDTSKDYARNGLRNMKFRGEKIGGKVTIRSTIGKGTTVTLVLRVG